MSGVLSNITARITPSAEALGYRIVQVRFNDGNKSRVLQIMAERLSDGGMNLKDCETLSHQVSAILDVEDLISDAYRLEISSPGIDRPLVRAEDYANFIGHQAKIELNYPLDGRKRFSGKLTNVAGGEVSIACESKEFTLPIASVASAKLVLTDALIKEHQKKYAKDTKINESAE